jgi:uncharacterized protein YkwD
MRLLTLLAVVGVGVLAVSATVGTGVGALDSRTPAVDRELEAVGDAVADALEPDPVNTTVVEREIHAQINAERRARGLAPLAYRERTAASAGEHSTWMASSGQLEHANLAAQYRCEPAGENIAYTYASEDIVTDDGDTVNYYGNETEIARGLVRQWMHSPEHRENLLDPRFSAEGIGVAVGEGEEGRRVYATQALCG